MNLALKAILVAIGFWLVGFLVVSCIISIQAGHVISSKAWVGTLLGWPLVILVWALRLIGVIP